MKQLVPDESAEQLVQRRERIQSNEEKRKHVQHTETIFISHQRHKKMCHLFSKKGAAQCHQLMSSDIDWGDGRVNGNMVQNRNHRNEEQQGNQTKNIRIRIISYQRQTPARANFDFGFVSHIQLGLADDPIVAQNVA